MSTISNLTNPNAALQGAPQLAQAGATTAAAVTASTEAQAIGAVATDKAPGAERLANARLGDGWSEMSGTNSYQAMFGNQGYVKDGSDPELLSMLQSALSKAPELASTNLGQHVSMGKVGPEDIQTLQGFLEKKGFSVGSPGVDGKYGPLTHKALERFLNDEPPEGGDAAGADSASKKGGTQASAAGKAPGVDASSTVRKASATREAAVEA